MAADANAKQPLKFCTRIPSIEMVPAPTKAEFASIKTNQRKRLSKRELNITPHYGCSRVGAGTTIKSDANEVVPAPMREDTIEIVQPLDRAGTTIKSDANEVVPAPRLELGTP